MTATDTMLPTWDMTPVFPGLESSEFARGFESAMEAIVALGALFDTHQIGQRSPSPLDAATVQVFEQVIPQFNAALKAAYRLGTYIHCFVAVDSRDTQAQARLSEMEQRADLPLAQLSARLTAWIGSLDVDALIAQSAIARDHAFALHRAHQMAAHQMSMPEENLAAELALTGGSAWDKLYHDYTSQLLVPFERDGKTEELPMSRLRNLAFDADRRVRQNAYEAEVTAWKMHALPIAAALNSIKGETLALTARRKWDSPLDAALFGNTIDRATLDAMMTAARESFPDFRRYLNAKARALGLPRLAWYDLFAPMSQSSKVWDYQEGVEFIVANFRAYSDRLSDFAARAFRENWIDARPRAGKVGGAFCASLRDETSRILSNYNFSFGGVSTLAHELGHAYHNLNLSRREMLQRRTPMALAETASIFCETIVTQAALQQADRDGQIELLEESLQGACQVVVDIISRFLFEQSVFQARRQRELSVAEFCDTMRDAQLQTYGDGLDPDTLHTFAWASRGHYYSSTYYNYPYMFGLLFGLGLYTRYQQEPEPFKAGYDDLLSSTGMADAATLADRFGIDLRTPDFWRSSFDVIRGQIAQFEGLLK